MNDELFQFMPLGVESKGLPVESVRIQKHQIPDKQHIDSDYLTKAFAYKFKLPTDYPTYRILDENSARNIEIRSKNYANIYGFDTNNPIWNIQCDADDKRCARYITKFYGNVLGNNSIIKNGVFGNAWNMPQNIVDAGGLELFNVFNNSQFTTDTQVRNFYKNQPDIDYSILQPGDIVGINYPTSSYQQEAVETGTTYNTHVGLVSDVKNGIPIITHNFGVFGVQKEPADKLKAHGKITVAVRPKDNKTSFVSTPSIQSDITLPQEYMTSEMQEFINSAEGSKNLMKELFPNSNPDIVMNLLLGVLKRETNFMQNKVSDQKSLKSKLMQYAKNKYRNYKGLTDETKSSNLTKFKLSTLNSQARQLLGIIQPADLEIPSNAAKAGMYILSRNYDYLKRLQNKYPELGITDDDINAAVISSYNQGMNKYWHLGFDPNTGEAKPEELEQLRYFTDPNNKIWDITATNYKYLNYLGLGKLGDFLYKSFENPHVPYIASGLESQKLINKKLNTDQVKN